MKINYFYYYKKILRKSFSIPEVLDDKPPSSPSLPRVLTVSHAAGRADCSHFPPCVYFIVGRFVTLFCSPFAWRDRTLGRGAFWSCQPLQGQRCDQLGPALDYGALFFCRNIVLLLLRRGDILGWLKCNLNKSCEFRAPHFRRHLAYTKLKQTPPPATAGVTLLTAKRWGPVMRTVLLIYIIRRFVPFARSLALSMSFIIVLISFVSSTIVVEENGPTRRSWAEEVSTKCTQKKDWFVPGGACHRGRRLIPFFFDGTSFVLMKQKAKGFAMF